MNNKLVIGLLIGIVIGAVGMYGVNRYMLSQRRNMMLANGGGRGGYGQRGSQPMGSIAPQPTSSASAELQNGEKVFTISGSNFKFEPNYIAVNQGDKIKIVFNNTGGFHDFVVDGYNVRTKQIQGGSSDSIEFTADKTGTFDFYCSVGNHRAMGMQGTLVVQ